MLKYFIVFLFLFPYSKSFSQLHWKNVDSLYQPLPKSVHVYFTDDRIQDTAPFRAFYLIADLKDKHLNFTTDTTYKRRFTPKQFYEKDDKPIAVVNGTFFSFETNQNLNVVIKDGKLVSYTAPVKGRGKDSLTLYYPCKSALGIKENRQADIAWLYTDSLQSLPIAYQFPLYPDTKENVGKFRFYYFGGRIYDLSKRKFPIKKWNVQTAIGGGPVLLQNGEVFITNEEEMMFTGKGLTDKHPRTAMGYTKDNKLIILVVQGRSESGSGASLIDEAKIFKDLGCVEALNLDGGGSSCLLVNGKETIKPSDKTGERAVPAVFIIGLNHD